MIPFDLPVKILINDSLVDATAKFHFYPAVFIGNPIDDNLEEDEIELAELQGSNNQELIISKEQEEELLGQGLRHHYQLQKEKKGELDCYKADFEISFRFENTNVEIKSNFFQLI